MSKLMDIGSIWLIATTLLKNGILRIQFGKEYQIKTPKERDTPFKETSLKDKSVNDQI